MSKYKQHCHAVAAAAIYYVSDQNQNGEYDVIMKDNIGSTSVIDTKSNYSSAYNAAKRWQKKENRAVLKSQGYI